MAETQKSFLYFLPWKYSFSKIKIKIKRESYNESHGKNEHEKGTSNEDVLRMPLSLHARYKIAYKGSSNIRINGAKARLGNILTSEN